MKKSILLLLALCVHAIVSAQSYPPADLQGAALRTWLKTNWYDGRHSNLSYNNARRAMYSRIDKASDGDVYCVYTGFHEAAANVTFLDPINAEHTVPQSWFGSSRPMQSDIHHLFPTHKDVNSNRGSLPFAEIPDSQTNTWYTVNSNNSGLTSTSSIPSSNIDAYSERRTNVSFEVREDHKGNTARAIFYFYTMYPTQAGSIDAIGDINELYQWHLDDPVDDWERQRNTRTQTEQGNLNPYISHPELVGLAWGFSAPTPVVNFASAIGSISEGNSGTTTYQVTVAASAAPSTAATFDVVVDGSASTTTAGVDFSLSTTSVTLTNSNFSQTISVLVNGDTDLENDETVVLKLQNISGGANLGTQTTHTLTITNDDTSCDAPTTVASSISSSSISTSAATLSWANGNGTSRLVLIKEGSDFAVGDVPSNGNTYGATAMFGDGDEIGEAFVVFNGTSNSVTVSQLIANTTYFVKVIEYGCATPQYIASGNPSASFTTADFASATSIAFTASTATIASESQGQVTLQLGEQLNAASTVELFVSTTNGLVNGTDFTTTPSSNSGSVTLTIPAETTQASIDIQSLSGNAGDVTLTILNTSSNLTAGSPNSVVVTIQEPSGLEEDLAKAGIRIFPNPAKSGVFIQQQEFNGKSYTVGLHTLLGKEIKQVKYDEKEVFYTFPQLTNGIYLLRLEVDGKVYFKRIMVQ